MCLPAHSREAIEARGDSAGGCDREINGSLAASREGARFGSQNDALIALGSVFLLLTIGFSALGSDPWPFNQGTVRADGTLGWVVRLADRAGTSGYCKQGSSSRWRRSLRSGWSSPAGGSRGRPRCWRS